MAIVAGNGDGKRGSNPGCGCMNPLIPPPAVGK